LGSGDGRCDVRTGEKGGFSVGKTKKGKGTKLLVLIDGQGLPLGCYVDSAQQADVEQIEPLLNDRILDKQSPRLIYDRAADSDALRDRLAEAGIELICPHRKNRKRPPKQDGRKLRRYRHRWHVEQTICWLGNCRRLLVRHEHFDHLYYGFAQLACIRLLLKRLMAL
jgi:transposase